MSQCGWLSDRMPAVALGRAEWTPEEIRHLTGCESCRREWELVHTTSRLGDGLLRPIDTPAMASRLLQRLDRARASHRRRTWGLAVVGAAATIAALLWVESPRTPPAARGTTAVAALEIPLPELDGLQPAELDSVLQNMDVPLSDATALESPELGDLDSDELETVLDTWEG